MFFGRQLWFKLKITYSARSECTFIIGWVSFWIRILIFCFKKMCNKCKTFFFKSPMRRNKDANSKMILSHHGTILYGGKWNQLGYGRMFMYNCIVRLYYIHLGLQSTNARFQTLMPTLLSSPSLNTQSSHRRPLCSTLIFFVQLFSAKLRTL